MVQTHYSNGIDMFHVFTELPPLFQNSRTYHSRIYIYDVGLKKIEQLSFKASRYVCAFGLEKELSSDLKSSNVYFTIQHEKIKMMFYFCPE